MTFEDVMTVRSDQDYEDFIFAIKAIESGEARDICADANVSQHEVGRRLGISHVSVYRWEHGGLPRIEVGIAYGRMLREFKTSGSGLNPGPGKRRAKITQTA